VPVVLFPALRHIIERDVWKLEHCKLELFLESGEVAFETRDSISQGARLHEQLLRILFRTFPARDFLSDAVARGFSLFDCLDECAALDIQPLCAIDESPQRFELAATAHAATKHFDMLAYHSQVVHCYLLGTPAANDLKPQRPDVDPEAWLAFRNRMYGGDFVFNVSREFVRTCKTPMLVLLGNDRYHPSITSREIVELAPNAELVERWKEPEVIEQTIARVRSFLTLHTPQQ